MDFDNTSTFSMLLQAIYPRKLRWCTVTESTCKAAGGLRSSKHWLTMWKMQNAKVLFSQQLSQGDKSNNLHMFAYCYKCHHLLLCVWTHHTFPDVCSHTGGWYLMKTCLQLIIALYYQTMSSGAPFHVLLYTDTRVCVHWLQLSFWKL